jgi:hypothetical protein
MAKYVHFRIFFTAGPTRVPPDVRLRQLLKRMRRDWALRCDRVEDVREDGSVVEIPLRELLKGNPPATAGPATSEIFTPLFEGEARPFK